MKSRLPSRIRELLFKRFHIGLGVRIMAGLTLLAVTLILLIGIVALKVTERNLLTQKAQEGEVMVNMINAMIAAQAMQNPIGLRDLVDSEVPDLMLLMSNRLGLMDFFLLDTGYRVLAARDGKLLGQFLHDEHAVRTRADEKLHYRLIKDSSGEFLTSLGFTGPIFYRGRLAGLVRFTLPLEEVWQTINFTRRLFYIYTLLDAIIIVFVGSYLLSRVLVRPLRELVVWVRRIGEGGLDAPLPKGRRFDEIGLLTDAFSEMVDNLKRNREQQQRQLRSLERINEDLRQAQKELVSTDRLAYVGRVAAGVAHEIGNPLAAIFGYLDILHDEQSMDLEGFQGYRDRIEKEAQRIDDIVRSLLDFAKPSGEGLANVAVNQVVNDSISIVKKQRVMDRIEFVESLGSDLPPVRVDAKLLLQVIVNLLINAKDALNECGQIRVLTDSVLFDRLEASVPEMSDLQVTDDQSLHQFLQSNICFSGKMFFNEGQEVVKISIADDGTGISEKNIRSLFEPFFTTKEPMKGTGLGLAICQRIIHSFGGVIKVESKLGSGAILSIFLPSIETDQDQSGS